MCFKYKGIYRIAASINQRRTESNSAHNVYIFLAPSVVKSG